MTTDRRTLSALLHLCAIVSCLPSTTAFLAPSRQPVKSTHEFHGYTYDSILGRKLFHCDGDRRATHSDSITLSMKNPTSPNFAQDGVTASPDYRSPMAYGMSFVHPDIWRVTKVIAVAYLIAESLSYLGILEDPKLVKVKLQQLFVQIKEALLNFPTSTKTWYHKHRQKGGLLHWNTWRAQSLKHRISQWEPKHQFAVGTGFGLFISEFVWAVSRKLCLASFAIYLFAEFNNAWKDNHGKSPMEQLHLQIERTTGLAESLTSRAEDAMETVRGSVRHTVTHPVHAVRYSIPKTLANYVKYVALPPKTKHGLLAGLSVGVLVL